MLQFVVFLLLIPSVRGLEFTLVKPINSGTDVGLVVLPGAYLESEQYAIMAEYIQSESRQRVWVSLAGDFLFGVVNPGQVKAAIEGGAKSLWDGGMPENAPIFVAGHSLGGVFIQDAVGDYDYVAGMLLWAAYTPYGDLAHVSRPTLTLSGDLDGQTRVSRIAKQFEELLEIMAEEPNAIYETSVVVLESVNHGQFASGQMPPRVEAEDIPSPLTDLQAKTLIAEASANFMAYFSEDEGGDVHEDARKYLEDSHFSTRTMLSPYISLMELDEVESAACSPWIIECQKLISTLWGEDRDNLKVNNIVVKDDFSGTRTRIKLVQDIIHINTSAIIVRASNSVSRLGPQTADYISTKMVSREAIQDISDGLGLDFIGETRLTCSDLNQAAWERAWEATYPAVRNRFIKAGLTVEFIPDEETWYGPGFITGNLTLAFTDGVVKIQTIGSLHTPVSSLFGGGVQYCHIISPAKALEFMAIDVHKPEDSRVN